MGSIRILAGIVSAVILAVPGETVSAQTAPQTSAAPGTQASPIPPPAVAEAAERLLQNMSAYIGSADQFTFRADVVFDHVLPSGQKLQFTAIENVAVQRPGGVYVEWGGDLGERRFWYDGKDITLYDGATLAYGTEAMPSTIDGMLDKLSANLRFLPPLSDFLHSNPYRTLRAAVQYGFVTGDTQLNGRTCTGLAFVEKQIDWQIWIDTGPQPVPCKLVITYKNHPSMPQFNAMFSEWDFSPRIAASTFKPSLPAAAHKIPFAAANATVGSG